MILYRLQVVTGDDWTTEWHPTQQTAKVAFAKAVVALDEAADLYLDAVDVPTGKDANGSGRENIAAALNHASVSRVNWPGKETIQTHRVAGMTDAEDLLS